MRSKTLRNACAAAVLAAGFAGAASADVIVFNFTEPFDTKPDADGLFRATITDVAANQVEIKLENLVSNTFDDFAPEWYFNIGNNSSTIDFSSLTATRLSGETASSVTASYNAYKADGDGYYDLLFSFPTSAANRFNPGDTSTYRVTFAGLTASAFENLSAPGGGHGPYLAAVKVQAITDSEGSTWLRPGEDGVQPIPLPAAAWGGMALLGGLGLLKLRARRHQPA